MDAIEALTSRVSMPRLIEPAPTATQLDTLIQAATRAADHGALKPWRFLIVDGDERHHLGEIFCKAALMDEELNDTQQERIRSLPLRAPMLMVAIARCQEHPKVPRIEQMISTGAAVQNILNAAYAIGIGAFWRTGVMSYSKMVQHDLGLGEGEKIIGFIYLGTPDGEPRPHQPQTPTDFYQHWQR